MNLKVEEIKIQDKKKYMLLDKEGEVNIPVTKFLKYLDNINKSPNTVRTYAYHLKNYFEYLEIKEKDFTNANIDLLSDYISWLRKPEDNGNVISLGKKTSVRRERTINLNLSAVFSFYDYLSRNELYQNKINENLKIQIGSSDSGFKSFLSHLGNKKTINKNILKVREPKREIKTLKREEIECIRKACSNQRDELLIRVLYEGGLRISEALNLRIEDFDISENSIIVTKSKTVSGERRKVYISENTMSLFQDYLIDTHSYDSNFVFVNLKGDKEGKQIQDWTARDIVKRIKNKTGIDFTPHMLRHTYATELHDNGVDIAVIQKLLGHAQVQTTINTYLHPSDKKIREEYEKVFKRPQEEDVDENK